MALRSKSKGAKDGKGEPKLGGRFDKYAGGAVPQNPGGRTPQEQIAYLDSRGFAAARERAKLLKKIEDAQKPKPAEGGAPVSRYQAKQAAKR